MDADPAPFSAASARTERSLANLRPWTKGRSGNPKGRPPAAVDIAALARVHGPRCIEVAAELLEDPDPRIRLAALVALLDRGFGRPAQTVMAADNALSLQFQHLVAARAVSDALHGAPHTLPAEIEGTVEQAAEADEPPDLLTPALE
jgi:hypothetical protein